MWSIKTPKNNALTTQDTNNTRVEVKVETHSGRQHKQTFYIKVNLVAFVIEVIITQDDWL